MARVDIPNFGELLAEHLGGVPPGAYPYLLSQLERSAAARYRGWAEAVPDHAHGLLACAAREDEIADRVDALFPPSEEQAALVASVVPGAVAAYYAVFEPYSPVEQMTIQAAAERQGATAWQTLKSAYPQHAEALDALSSIELESAGYLDGVLQALGAADEATR
jgi:hypothetical protein